MRIDFRLIMLSEMPIKERVKRRRKRDDDEGKEKMFGEASNKKHIAQRHKKKRIDNKDAQCRFLLVSIVSPCNAECGR
jgi:hypothetical protein